MDTQTTDPSPETKPVSASASRSASTTVQGLIVVWSLLACGLLYARATAQAQRTTANTLDGVIAEAGTYVVEYGRALTSVLAEETYVQRLVWGRDQSVKQERKLRSEIAFIRLVDSTEWLTFRNVLSVDDAAIPDANGRLERLFRNSPVSLVAQAHLIARESARFNIGPIARDINVPTTALHFLHPKHRPNCRFNKEREDMLDGERVWVIRFKERERGSLIRGADGHNLPALGRFWIVPADGRVVRSELVIEDFVGAAATRRPRSM